MAREAHSLLYQQALMRAALLAILHGPAVLPSMLMEVLVAVEIVPPCRAMVAAVAGPTLCRSLAQVECPMGPSLALPQPRCCP